MKSQGMRAQTPISLTVAAVLAAAACSAFAADVEVYGRIDTGFLYTINHNDTANNVQMTSGHSSGSRFGLKGGENLGGGWKAKFVLENGFTGDDGSFVTAGNLFSRQSTLAISHKSFGELAFGRAGKPLSGSDQYTRIRSFLPFGVTYGDAGMLFYGKGGRVSNAMFYQSPTIAGVTALVAGSLNTKKEEQAKWADNERFLGGSVDWKRGNFGLMVGMEKIFLSRDNRDGKNNPTTYFLGTYYDFGVMKLMAAYQRGENLDRMGYFSTGTSGVRIGGSNAQIQNFDANSWLLGATVPVGVGTLRLSAQYTEGHNERDLASKKLKNPVGQDAGYWAVAAGYTYPFSKRTNVYGVISHLQGLDALKQDKLTVANSDGDLRRNQIAIGLVHKF